MIEDAVVIGSTIPLPVAEMPADTPYYDLPQPEPSVPAVIPYSARDKTVYVLGQSGMGKSTFLLNMLRQDIQNGKGVAVVDPTGDLAEIALSYVPEERVADCVYLDPVKSPIGIDFFAAADDLERERVRADMRCGIIKMRLA